MYLSSCAPLRRGSRNGPFEMDAERRRGRSPRLARRGDRGGHHLAARRSPASAAGRRCRSVRCAAAMRGDALGRRVVVEQDAAAAIDLHIDKARRKQAAAEIARRAVRSLGVRDDRGDALAFDDERVVVEKALAVEDPRAGQERSSDGLRHFAQVARAVGIAPEPARERLGKAVEAVDHDDRARAAVASTFAAARRSRVVRAARLDRDHRRARHRQAARASPACPRAPRPAARRR